MDVPMLGRRLRRMGCRRLVGEREHGAFVEREKGRKGKVTKVRNEDG